MLKASFVSTAGAKQVGERLKGKGKTMSSVRKIRSYEEDFDPRVWVDEAMEIYIAAHKALADGEHDLLHKYATEKAYPEMMNMAHRYISAQEVSKTNIILLEKPSDGTSLKV